jgi:hypothetical protein
MSSSQPSRVTALRGRITHGVYAKGTKSERETVFIETVDNRYIFRLKKGSAFGNDELNQYIGHDVVCDGFLIGNTLLAERIDIVE